MDSNCSLTSSSVTKHNKIGQVSYTYEYTDSSDRQTGELLGCVSVSVECKKDVDPIILSNNYMIANFAEIKQISNNRNHTTNLFSCSIVGSYSRSVQSYLSILEGLFSTSSCALPFLENLSYTFYPLKNSFSSQVSSFDAFPV